MCGPGTDADFACQGVNLAVWVVQAGGDLVVHPVVLQILYTAPSLYPSYLARMLVLTLASCGLAPLSYLVGANVTRLGSVSPIL